MRENDQSGTGAFVPGPRAMLPPTAEGRLSGLSFAVKDLIDVAGHVTGGGNPDWLRTHKPATQSAPVVERLLAAGAALSGKTITDELAFSLEGVNAHYGTPLNTACPDRIPGGSSSGSASALAAGMVDFALGTDTGGSVRVPASFCGLYGFRPTHDAIPLTGVIPFAPSYDTVGWFARDMATLSAVGDVLLPRVAPSPIRKLVLVRDTFALAGPDVAASLSRVCADLGVESEISLFNGEESEWLECYRVLQGAEIWHELGPWIAATKPAFGPAMAPRFADAATITEADVARFNPRRAAFAARVCTELANGIGLIIPTAPCIALRKDASGEEIGAFYLRALTLTAIAGHGGLPQLTLPAAQVDDCPVGLSIVAGANCDRALLDLATPWASLLSNKNPT
ncbi:amidase [Bradyrhizobium sp. SK17]|uniref:amidase n=1 Tax=Bradyrhizobium sp. SK17 TaxID=2057741 RepID=UPI000C316EB7|nr:amidase [Bradyrhizobium sp. SK17]AUC99644.1 amidase [Bradyrhizobium sp. SK17]